MNGRYVKVVAFGFCLVLTVGCSLPGPQLPIIQPQRIDQKEASEKLISRYSELVTKTNRVGFEYATAICRRIQGGELTLVRRKVSQDGRNTLFLFNEKDRAGLSDREDSIVAFSFHPGAELIRMCNQKGLCDVYVRNGKTIFARIDIGIHGEPTVDDTGISVKSIQDRSFSYDLLFSYQDAHKREGDELISIFLSAFPFLFYQ